MSVPFIKPPVYKELWLHDEDTGERKRFLFREGVYWPPDTDGKPEMEMWGFFDVMKPTEECT